MAVNTNFYVALNELVTRGTKGQITGIIDHKTFIDAGKKLADMAGTDLANGFLSELMNRIKLVLDTFRNYEDALGDMVKGSTAFGTIEMVIHDFVRARYSPFVQLPDTYDDATMNPFIIAKPAIEARYFTKSNAWEHILTIQDTDLRGAWASEEGMLGFIRRLTGDVLNSQAYEREVARLGMLQYLIAQCMASVTEATNPDSASVKYNVLKLYNDVNGTSLTKTQALANNDFIRFAVALIRKVSGKMTKPTAVFNVAGDHTTFTPKGDQRLKINAAFDSAIRSSVVDAYNKEYGMIDQSYEVMEYWEDLAHPLQIVTDETQSVGSEYILAVNYDDFALGEYIDYQNTTSQRNERCEYTNYFWHNVRRYVYNGHANSVVFYMEDAA